MIKEYQKTWEEATKSGDLDIPELSFRKKIVLRTLGIVRIENRRYVGWSGDLPFYVFNCSKHGLVCDYKHKWPPFKKPCCPLCRYERDNIEVIYDGIVKTEDGRIISLKRLVDETLSR